MRGLSLGIVALLLGVSAFATLGSFQGTLVEAPPQQASAQVIWVQGRNQMIRRVEIAHAVVSYDDGVPSNQRTARAEEALTPGAVVMVTAEQDGNGEWQAREIRILKPAAQGRRAAAH
jgi:hypothetical protein